MKLGRKLRGKRRTATPANHLVKVAKNMVNGNVNESTCKTQQELSPRDQVRRRERSFLPLFLWKGLFKNSFFGSAGARNYSISWFRLRKDIPFRTIFSPLNRSISFSRKVTDAKNVLPPAKVFFVFGIHKMVQSSPENGSFLPKMVHLLPKYG